MPKVRRSTNYTQHTSFFEEAVERYARGRVSVDNPTITDYIQYYGSKKELALHYAEENNLKYDTARKQIERMMQKPNMRLKSETVARLGRLQVNEDNVVITITGWYSYDGITWEYNTFSNVRRPFSASEARDIVRTTQYEGNQAGVEKFLQYYGVSGLSPMFATQDLSISIGTV